jgi:superfamily I DNA/RNA helicase
MNLTSLSNPQLELIEKPLTSKLFLEGPAGTGKTSVGIERMLYLMSKGVRGDSILLLVPQRTLAGPYYEALRHPGVLAGGSVQVMTVNGLAQRMLELFWPIAAQTAAFAQPDLPPVFLTLETAQYFMARVVRPMLDQGHFEGVALAPNRLYSQVLDNLNKAAAVGFPHTEIGARLKAAWIGETSQKRIYDDAQEAATRFRSYCLEHNLLDFSLQLELFIKYLWNAPLCRDYLRTTFRHLIADNIEEDVPVSHDLLQEWLPEFESALLIFDQQAGYRVFLGADPSSAYRLRELCDEQAIFTESHVTSPPLQELAEQLGQALLGQPLHLLREGIPPEGILQVLRFKQQRYFPQMIDWVARQISQLVHEEGVLPHEIAVLSPYLTDALRFSLTDRLERESIQVRSHRPSRSLREEPATQCLLTLAALAHPGWSQAKSSTLQPTKFDVAYALLQAIEGLDLVRAQLLTEIVYRVKDGAPTLSSFDQIRGDTQERITYLAGQRYEHLRVWILDYIDGTPEEFDHFLSRLFGEVLSQPGYRFHQDFNAGEVAANLVDSARDFRWSVGENLPEDGRTLGQEYIEMVQKGVVAAQYIRSWQRQSEQAVLLAPAYTFLMYNRPLRIQFWLDVGSRGWFERLYQPLTHPHVLSRRWPPSATWTDHDELRANQETLQRLTSGLLHRCREGVYLGLSDLNEQGYEQQGPLLKAFNRILRGRKAQPDGI